MSATPSTTRLNRLLGFVQHDPGNLALRKDAIGEAFATGYWKTARELIETGLERYPGEPSLLALYGCVHLHAQHYVDAEKALSAALSSGVEAAEVRYNLGFALFMQKRYADALGALAEPVIAQAVPAARVLRARCLHHLDRREEAIADCRVQLAATPDAAEIHGLLALLLYELHQNYDARNHADAALRRDSQQLEALLTVASMYLDTRQYALAGECFSALVRAHPKCGRGWFGLALIELSEMQLDAARQDIERAVEYTPEHIGTWHVLAWIHILRSDIPAADAALRRAFALDRNFAETHGGLAVVAALAGRQDEAEASIKRARRLDPRSLSALYARILLLQNHGRYPEAAALLDSVLSWPADGNGTQYRQFVTDQLRILRARHEATSSGVVRH